ncbi:hypothetical protein ACWPKO_09950 [Coraliomargarita sp. W4R53]
MLLILYAGLVAGTTIWVTKREAAIMTAAAVLGLFIFSSLELESRAAGNLFSAYIAVLGIYMAIRIHLKKNQGTQNMSMSHTDEAFEFTPLNHQANDPSLLSKHPIDKPAPREASAKDCRSDS